MLFFWYEQGLLRNVFYFLPVPLCCLGWVPQWLSYLWYLSDGRIRRRSLTWTHILHLGIFKRWAPHFEEEQFLICINGR